MQYKYGKYKVSLNYFGEIEEYVYAKSSDHAIQIIKEKLQKMDDKTFLNLLKLNNIQEKCNWTGEVTNSENDKNVFNNGCFKEIKNIKIKNKKL